MRPLRGRQAVSPRAGFSADFRRGAQVLSRGGRSVGLCNKTGQLVDPELVSENRTKNPSRSERPPVRKKCEPARQAVLLGCRFQCSDPTPCLSFGLMTQCGVGCANMKSARSFLAIARSAASARVHITESRPEKREVLEIDSHAHHRCHFKTAHAGSCLLGQQDPPKTGQETMQNPGPRQRTSRTKTPPESVLSFFTFQMPFLAPAVLCLQGVQASRS